MIIFITGGVMSSLGKGIVASALGALLRGRNLRIKLRKLDPYINIDPGTVNPYEHGEVFVTRDGAEVDLDFGSYERFTCVDALQNDSITTGKIYRTVIEGERRGDYLGQTVQVIPHITNEIKVRMLAEQETVDILICEMGGTVGDIEGLPFLEALRQIRQDKRVPSLVIHLAWVPYFESSQEIKTKLTQHSIKDLQHCGVQPDILVCRCDRSLSKEIKQKLSLFCNVPLENVIEAQNVKNIYETPLTYHQAGLDERVVHLLGLPAEKPNLKPWQDIMHTFQHPQHSISIGIIGKYTRLPDTYRSVIEALRHGGLAHEAHIDTQLIDAEQFQNASSLETLEKLDGIIVPGGFGARGTEEMIRVIGYARTHGMPFLGICLGMQLAVIESVRQLPGMEQAASSECGVTPLPIIALLMEWMDEERRVMYQKNMMGGTMRLGSYDCELLPESRIAQCYGRTHIQERHRHRYEVNAEFIPLIKQSGLVISGMHRDLVECIEIPQHPWFIATQFHPEFQSRPFAPHPLFTSFVQAALTKNAERGSYSRSPLL